jgi:hypothetical protein
VADEFATDYLDGADEEQAAARAGYRDLSTAQQTIKLSVPSVEMTYVLGTYIGR